MRILLLTNKSPWPPKDGGAAATLGMAEGLAALGAKVSIASLNTLKHFVCPEELQQRYGKEIKIKTITADTGTKIPGLIRNIAFTGKPYTLERFESPEFRKYLRSLPSDGFEIIQVEGLAMARYFDSLERFKGARIAFRPHNVEYRIWQMLSENEKNPARKAFFRMTAVRTEQYERRVPGWFDGIAAMTSDDLDWFIKCGYKGKHTVCQPGFLGGDPCATAGRPGTVFFIGALDWIPNIAGLKWFVDNVWPRVTKTNRDAEFHVAGRNPAPSVRRIARGKNIHFHGETEDSVKFISEMQVMAVPLFAGSGIRMKIIEGMALGKTIVGTSVAARGLDYAGDRDIFVRDTAQEFAACISELLNNDKLREMTAQNAVKNVSENYNILASAEKMMKFYSRLF